MKPGTSASASRGHSALRRGRISLTGHVYHVSTAVRQRRCVFADFRAGCAAAACFADARLLGDSRLLAWVLMPDHVHWLLQLGGNDSLPAIVIRLKSASARATNATTQRRGPLWAPAYHDHAMRGDEDAVTTALYIIHNPVRAGLVASPVDYPFWDSLWLP